MNVKYPHVNVPLLGEDSNAFAIISRVRGALKRAGVDKAEIEEFTREAQSRDYDHVIQTVMLTVSTS